MIVLVLGPNGSGKSVYAEKLAARLSRSTLVYIATMIPYGDEGVMRVKRHRKQRERMGFITVEKPCNVSELSLPSDATVLLEDVSNLLGNALFSGECRGDAVSVFNDITALCAMCCGTVMVSIDELTPNLKYDTETCLYIRSLQSLNQRLCDFADIVISMRDGVPVFIKGDANALD